MYLRLLQPPLEFLYGDATLVAFLFLLSGLLAPRIKLTVADAPGLDPREAAFVLPAVDLEYRIVRLLQRPLLESSHRPAAGLTVEWCAVAVLCTDAACLGKVPPAVFAATHGNIALHAGLQRKADHIRHCIRKLAIPQRAVELLVEEHAKHPHSPYLFVSPKTGTMFDPDSFRHTHEKILKAIGAEHIRFHDLRHTFATLSLKYGVDVKTLSGALGHYDAGFTLSTYTHATAEMMREAADTMGDVIGRAI